MKENETNRTKNGPSIYCCFSHTGAIERRRTGEKRKEGARER